MSQYASAHVHSSSMQQTGHQVQMRMPGVASLRSMLKGNLAMNWHTDSKVVQQRPKFCPWG